MGFSHLQRLIIALVWLGAASANASGNTQPVDFVLDFESGDLRGWTKTGTAFDHQPTFGDNPSARHRGQPSQHQGKWWIGTFESFQSKPDEKAGATQGDGPTGTLTSAPFTISAERLVFLVGGGSSPKTRVELVVDGNPVLSASGRNTETMASVTWDLKPYKGKPAMIRLVDDASGGWGHINADDFVFQGGAGAADTSASAASSAAANGPFSLDFETGDLSGWSKTGTAFDAQPTFGDNPSARHRGQPSQHQGQWWIGTFEKFQNKPGEKAGTTQGDKPTGTLTSPVFTITASSLTFLVGGGSSAATRVELLVDGTAVLKASGRNTETMASVTWDLKPYKGKQAAIRIVDEGTGGWGHINADAFAFAGQ